MFNVILNGEKQHTLGPTLDCSDKQLATINDVADILLKAPILIEIAFEVLKDPLSSSNYASKIEITFKTYRKIFGNIDGFNELRELLILLHKNTKEIRNDAGRLVEALGGKAIHEMYQNFPHPQVEYHCKVKTTCDEDGKLSMSIAERDIDVCGLHEKYGDLVECKKSLHIPESKTADDSKDGLKVNILSSLRLILQTAGTKYEDTKYDLRIFFFDRDDSPKAGFYRKTWPKMEFIGINRFTEMYCVNR